MHLQTDRPDRPHYPKQFSDRTYSSANWRTHSANWFGSLFQPSHRTSSSVIGQPQASAGEQEFCTIRQVLTTSTSYLEPIEKINNHNKQVLTTSTSYLEPFEEINNSLVLHETSFDSRYYLFGTYWDNRQFQVVFTHWLFWPIGFYCRCCSWKTTCWVGPYRRRSVGWALSAASPSTTTSSPDLSHHSLPIWQPWVFSLLATTSSRVPSLPLS